MVARPIAFGRDNHDVLLQRLDTHKWPEDPAFSRYLASYLGCYPLTCALPPEQIQGRILDCSAHGLPPQARFPPHVPGSSISLDLGLEGEGVFWTGDMALDALPSFSGAGWGLPSCTSSPARNGLSCLLGYPVDPSTAPMGGLGRDACLNTFCCPAWGLAAADPCSSARRS